MLVIALWILPALYGVGADKQQASSRPFLNSCYAGSCPPPPASDLPHSTDSVAGLQRLADAYVISGRPECAIEAHRRLVVEHPTAQEAAPSLERIIRLCDADRFACAREAYELLRTRYGSYAHLEEALKHLLLLYMAQSEMDERQIVRLLASYAPQHPSANAVFLLSVKIRMLRVVGQEDAATEAEHHLQEMLELRERKKGDFPVPDQG